MVSVTVLVGIFTDALAQGFIFALLGLSITLVFGLADILNLAIGTLGVIGVVLVFILEEFMPFPAALVGLVVAIVIGGLLIDRTLLSLIYLSNDEEERILLGIFVTVGLAIGLEGLLNVFTPGSYSLSIGIPAIRVGGVLIRGSAIATVVFSVVVLTILYLFFSRTYLGIASRTVMQDETGAVLYGINPRRVRSIVFVLSLFLGVFAVLLASLSADLHTSAGFEFSVFALIVSVVGGVTNVPRTILAGLGLGIVETFTSAFIGSYVSQVVLFAIVIGVLIASPRRAIGAG